MRSQRMTIVDEEGLQIDLEYNDSFFILHLPIFSATKGRLMHLRMKLEELAELATTIGYLGIYTAIDPYHLPMVKLMRLIYAEKQGSANGLDVYLYKGEA